MRLFSPSQLGTWNTCNLRWFFRYVENIKSPPGVAAIIGKGTHASIEGNLKAKMAGTKMPLEQARELARDATVKFWCDEPPMQEGDEEPIEVGEACDKSVVCATVHYNDLAPAIVPVEIEHEVKLEQVPGYDFGIRGFIDVLEATRIRDTKTKGKKPPATIADRGDNADHLTTYAFLTGILDAQLDVIVNTSRPYSFVAKGQTRTKQDIDLVLQRYQLMAQSIEAGIFHPAQGDSWACSKKWCGYWERCEYGERGKVVPVANLTKKTSLLDDL